MTLKLDLKGRLRLFADSLVPELGEVNQKPMSGDDVMGLRVCVIASGSRGNCIYVASATTSILIDAGLSCRETVRRLDAVGVEAQGLRAICLTHEHSDHRAGLAVLQRRLDIPLYANTGTVEGVERGGGLRGMNWNVFATGSPFEIGDLLLEPFSVPHDSYDPVGFAVSSGGVRIGIVTDMGVPTGVIRERLRNSQVIVVEANHDETLLKDSDRPWTLKQRIMGRQGHLSNEQAGELIADVAGPGLRAVFLAHISKECNNPGLAVDVVSKALDAQGQGHVKVMQTYQDQASEMLEVE